MTTTDELFQGSSASAHACCDVTASGSQHRPSFARCCLDVAGFVIPGVVLTLLPTYPARLGTGLSVLTATYLQILVVILAVASVLIVAAKHARRMGDLHGPEPQPLIRRTASGMSSRLAGVVSASGSFSPSPGARNRLASSPCCLVYKSQYRPRAA